MTAFAHWTAMHAWWIARRTERDAIGKPWAARKIESGEAPTTSNTVAPTPAEPRKRAPVQRSKRPLPDEGGPVTDADVETMKTAYAKLPATASAWATRVMVQGNDAPLPWNKLSVTKTVRRYELYRGVRYLALWGDGADLLDEIVLAICGQHNPTPPGAALAALDADQAKQFADIASDIANDVTTPYGDDGTLQLTTVA
jgi:hypothetical protein